jgi:hypothetical protein
VHHMLVRLAVGLHDTGRDIGSCCGCAQASRILWMSCFCSVTWLLCGALYSLVCPLWPAARLHHAACITCSCLTGHLRALVCCVFAESWRHASQRRGA